VAPQRKRYRKRRTCSPVDAPAATETVASTVALALLEVNVNVAPPVGAGAERVTVPVADVPPVTDEAERPKLVIETAL